MTERGSRADICHHLPGVHGCCETCGRTFIGPDADISITGADPSFTHEEMMRRLDSEADLSSEERERRRAEYYAKWARESQISMIRKIAFH